MKRFLMSGLAAAAMLSHAGVMDRGGVSMDLSQCEIKTAKGTGPDYVTNGSFQAPVPFNNYARGNWIGGENFQGVSPEKRKELLASGKKMFSRSIVTVDGANYARIATSPEVKKFRNEKGEPTVTNCIYQDIRVPSGGVYTLRFQVRGNIDKGPGFNSMVLLVSYLDEKGNKRLCTDLNQRIAVSGSFRECAVTLSAPSETRLIRPGFFVYGIGEIELGGIELRAAQSTHEISAELYPLGFMDNLFAVASGQPAALYFTVKNQDGLALKNPELYLELPDGFRLLTPSRLLKAFPEGKNVWRVPIPPNHIREEYTTGAVVPPLLITSDLPPDGKRHPVKFHTKNNGVAGTVRTFDLQVIPKIKSIQPKLFRIGAMPTYMNQYTGEYAALVADFYKDCGFNVIQNNYHPDMSATYRKAGLLRMVWQGPSNGYDMGKKDKPADVVFRRVDGSIEPAMYAAGYGEAICPAEVYRRGNYYRNVVLPPLLADIAADKFDMLNNNWEPQQCLRGCFCGRCREEFIAYSKLPADQVRAAWPGEIQDKWRELWLKFRAWQMGRLVTTIEEDVCAEGRKHGREFHFLPAITSQAMRDSETGRFPTYNPEEYIKTLPWICPWGPYVFRDMKSPYVYNNAAYLPVFLCARDVQAYLAKRISDPAKFPKLIAYPHGNQCFSWCTAPEMPAFEMYCYFLHRWKGAIAYIFPYGYDHRYFVPLAGAAEDIAAAEDFVFKGERTDRVKAVPVTSLPDSFYKGGAHSHYPDIPDQSLLQTIAYERDGKILAAVGNFWQKGECFFTLRVDGLAAKEPYAVFLPSQKAVFTKDDGTFFTGGELARGILLQAGAFRWNLYEIGPYRKGMSIPGVKVEQKTVRKTMDDRLPDIRKAMDFEAREAAKLKIMRGADEVPDYSGLKNLKGDGIEAQQENGVYTFLSPDQKLTVDLKRGGKIASWLYRETPVIAEHPEFGLGIEGAWEPRPFMLRSPVRVISLSKDRNALVLEMERRISHSESNFFEGATIRKKLRISDGEVKLASTIVNSTGDSQSLAFRWHNMILFPEFEYRTGKGPLQLKRNYGIRAFKRSSKPDTFLIQGKQRPAESISSPTAVFRDPVKHLELTVAAAPAEEFDAFVMWDGSTPAPSFEPVFRERTLNAGISVSYELTFTIQKGKAQ